MLIYSIAWAKCFHNKAGTMKSFIFQHIKCCKYCFIYLVRSHWKLSRCSKSSAVIIRPSLLCVALVKAVLYSSGIVFYIDKVTLAVFRKVAWQASVFCILSSFYARSGLHTLTYLHTGRPWGFDTAISRKHVGLCANRYGEFSVSPSW